jgi:hypothetical protein
MVIEYDSKTWCHYWSLFFNSWISTLMVLLNQHQFMTMTIPFLGSDFKWDHFARVVEKSIVFNPPHICEAWRFYVTLDLWKPHETQFPNIFFVIWQIFEIFGSQIKIKIIWSITKVLSNMWCCGLRVDNLGKQWLWRFG